ncbi:MAG: hypothetical protein KF754_13880 [Planctomycetes bacterium]|nr:hypothetical protein [Planctomycetota bacterium]
MRIRLGLLLILLFAAPAAAQEPPKAEPSIAELWATGCLWEVGDNRETVPKARQALIAAGEPALAHALTRLGAANSLETRCLSAVFAGWKAQPEMAPKALAGLVANIGHEDPTARRNVADLLDQIDSRDAIEPLLARVRTEQVEGVRMAQLAPLCRWKVPEALPLLITASKSRTERLRARAPSLLVQFEDDAARQRMLELMDDTTYYVADAAAAVMQTSSPAWREACLASLRMQLILPHNQRRTQFIRRVLPIAASVAQLDTPVQLLAALNHADAGVRGDAADALVTWKGGAGLLDKDTDVAGKLHAALDKETDPFARTSLVRAIQRLSDSRNKE